MQPKKMSLYLFLLILISFYGFDTYADSYSSLGVSISNYSGSGLSFRYHSNSYWGIQLTGGAVIDEDETSFGIGAEFQRDLTALKDKRMFLIFSLGWYGNTEEVHSKADPNAVEEIDVSYYKMAVGFGGEIAFGNTIVDNLTIGLSLFPVGISFKEKHSFPGYDDTSQVNFGASLFTHFNF